MKTCGLCKQEKPFTSFWKDSSKRFGVSSSCAECSLKKTAKYYQKNREKRIIYARQRRACFSAEIKKARLISLSYEDQKDKQKECYLRRRDTPHDKARRKKNDLARKLIKRLATPTWLTKEQRSLMRWVKAMSGNGWAIDHIVPIKNANVCGLNVPWNLRLVPEVVNRIKSNKLVPELLV